ncbi:MAG TPA: ABC transporter ATP-binding protein [Rhodobacteraceae bacterium]|nr:ABC transporter ATP-binding protein [Paracoccaceae bacterium]
MTDIEIKNVSKSWGDTVAVDHVSFTAPSGTLTVLLGPSGCGKSTTLRLIAGLETVSSGSIIIGGEDVTGQPAAKRNISMVFQSYALFPHLSIAENILFGLKVRRTGKAECARRLQKTSELLGLTGLLERKPAEISGGQQQRVALGRAIISERPICLMDEPLSNLDAKLRHEMRIELRALQQKLNMTMLYVTHDQAEAISMADQVVLINKGRIEQIAPPDGIYEKPATLFAARFIGTPPMNIIRLTPSGEQLVIAGTGHAVLPLQDGRDMMLGLRPEEISLVETGGFEATVRAGEYLGADTLLDCAIGSSHITVRTSHVRPPEPGTQVRLHWPREAQHFFETDTGRRRDDLGGAT